MMTATGLHWLTTHLSLELGPRNITVNCIAPGPGKYQYE